MSDLLLLAGTCLARTDAGDLHLRVLLPVTLTAPVARLVLVVDHVDLRAAGGPEDLGGDLVAAEFVHGQDVVNGRPALPAAAANDRVHERTLSPWCQARRGIAASSEHRGDRACRHYAPLARRSFRSWPNAGRSDWQTSAITALGSQTRRRQRISDYAPLVARGRFRSAPGGPRLA